MLKNIKDITKAVLSQCRLGFYHATAGAVDAHRRLKARAEWGVDLPFVRRIASPILDVTPPHGARLAILSQDGVPEFPAYVGTLTDDENAPGDMTVWLRADLQAHPGHTELGATKSVRITVGTNNVDITPMPDGSVVVDCNDIRLGSTTATPVALANLLDPQLSAIATALGQLDAQIKVLGGAGTVPPYVATSTAATKTKAE